MPEGLKYRFKGLPSAHGPARVASVVGFLHQDVGVPLAGAVLVLPGVILAVAGVEDPPGPDGGHVAREVELAAVVIDELGEENTWNDFENYGMSLFPF